jgi:hypothetical protein
MLSRPSHAASPLLSEAGKKRGQVRIDQCVRHAETLGDPSGDRELDCHSAW